MFKRLLCIFCILIMTSSLCACGAAAEEEIDESTLVIGKKGTITETIVDGFDKDYYDVNELKNEFDEAVSEYNGGKGEDCVKLTNIICENGQVHASLDFASFDDYEAFQNEEIFLGTISEAYDAGYSMDVTLKGVSEGDKIGKNELMNNKENRILIISEPVLIKTYSKILYVSANVEVINDKMARISSESDGLAYLILK